MRFLSQRGLPVGPTIAGAEARTSLQQLESRRRERLGLLLQMVRRNERECQPQPRQRLHEQHYTRRFERDITEKRQIARPVPRDSGQHRGKLFTELWIVFQAYAADRIVE